MKSETQNCPTCNGTGKAPLPDHLVGVLELFKGRTRLTAGEVNEKIKLDSQNAVNMRLERLRSMGLLNRDANARPFVYFRAGDKPEPAVTPKVKPIKTARKTRRTRRARPRHNGGVGSRGRRMPPRTSGARRRGR